MGAAAAVHRRPPFRVEDYLQEGNYVLRAELPGLDPEKDVEVSVEGGTLTIQAERHEEHKEPHHCEFRYGSLTRLGHPA